MTDTIDWVAAMESVEGQREFLVELIGLFFEEYPKLLLELRDSLVRQDSNTFRRSAHTLKGSLKFFGPNRAGELAAELEIRGKLGSLAGTDKEVLALEQAIHQLVPQLEQFAKPT